MATGRTVIRPRWFLWTLAASLVVNGLLNASRYRWVLGVAVVGVVALAALARSATVVDDRGVTSVRPTGTRKLAWRHIEALREDRVVKAVTPAGEEIPLPNVEWRARVAPEHVHPRSAQAIAQRARDAGYELALEDRTG